MSDFYASPFVSDLLQSADKAAAQSLLDCIPSNLESSNVVIATPLDNIQDKANEAYDLFTSTNQKVTMVLLPGNYGDFSLTGKVDVIGLGSVSLDRGCKTAVSVGIISLNTPEFEEINITGLSFSSLQVYQASYFNFHNCKSAATYSFSINNSKHYNCVCEESFGFGGYYSTYVNCVNTGGYGFSGIEGNTYVNCVNEGNYGFNPFYDYSSATNCTYSNCKSGNNSFCSIPDYITTPCYLSYLVFENCVAGNNSFGSAYDPITQNLSASDCKFVNCRASDSSFINGASYVSSCEFSNCKAKSDSFCSVVGGLAGCTFNNCIAGAYSFASWAQYMDANRFENCDTSALNGTWCFAGYIDQCYATKFINCSSGPNSFVREFHVASSSYISYCEFIKCSATSDSFIAFPDTGDPLSISDIKFRQCVADSGFLSNTEGSLGSNVSAYFCQSGSFGPITTWAANIANGVFIP